jgi:ribonuclease P protein component
MRNTIKKHAHFAMPDNAPVAKSAMFLAKMSATKFPGDARYGLVATKRTFKHAVQRNRARRLIRAWLADNESAMLPDMDYIFIARPPILDATKPQGVEAMKKALNYLKKV